MWLVAMFWTVYKTKEANQISELPTAVGAKGLLQIVKHIDKSFPNINTFATLSPIPTLSNKFSGDTVSIVVTTEF